MNMRDECLHCELPSENSSLNFCRAWLGQGPIRSIHFHLGPAARRPRKVDIYVLENNGDEILSSRSSMAPHGALQLLSGKKEIVMQTPMQIWKKRVIEAINSSLFAGTTEPRMTSAARTVSSMAAEAATMHEDWGPGPPPPFRIPPPPLPHFMLPDDLEDLTSYCQTTVDSPLDVCDTTFVSYYLMVVNTMHVLLH